MELNNSRHHGLTLVEILVSLALGLIIVTVAIMGMRTMFSMSNRISGNLSTARDAGQIMTSIDDSLRAYNNVWWIEQYNNDYLGTAAHGVPEADRVKATIIADASGWGPCKQLKLKNVTSSIKWDRYEWDVRREFPIILDASGLDNSIVVVWPNANHKVQHKDIREECVLGFKNYGSTTDLSLVTTSARSITFTGDNMGQNPNPLVGQNERGNENDADGNDNTHVFWVLSNIEIYSDSERTTTETFHTVNFNIRTLGTYNY